MAEYLEQEFGAGLGQRHEAELVDDQKLVGGELLLEPRQLLVIAGLHELVDQRGGGDKADERPFWQAARPRPRAMWVLPVPLLPSAMRFSTALDVRAAGELQGFVKLTGFTPKSRYIVDGPSTQIQ